MGHSKVGERISAGEFLSALTLKQLLQAADRAQRAGDRHSAGLVIEMVFATLDSAWAGQPARCPHPSKTTSVIPSG